MRVTLDIDDELLERARDATNIVSELELVREALKALVERENARELPRLDGSQPGLQDIRRRRPVTDPD